jgi:hypothetical protein
MIPFHLQRLCHFPPRLMALSEDIDKRRFPLPLRYLTATFSMRPRSRSFRHRPKSIDFIIRLGKFPGAAAQGYGPRDNSF